MSRALCLHELEGVRRHLQAAGPNYDPQLAIRDALDHLDRAVKALGDAPLEPADLDGLVWTKEPPALEGKVWLQQERERVEQLTRQVDELRAEIRRERERPGDETDRGWRPGDG